MTERNTVVGICESGAEAAACVEEFLDAGLDPAKLSVAGRGDQAGEGVAVCIDLDDRVAIPGKRNAFRGGIRGRLPGSAVFLIPGIGPLVVSGPLAGWIAGALESRVVIGGLSTLGAALYGIGIPESDILRYEASLESGRILVVIYGTAEEAARARNVLETAGAARTAIHPYLSGRWDR